MLVSLEDYANVLSFWVEMGIAVVADVTWCSGMDCVVAALQSGHISVLNLRKRRGKEDWTYHMTILTRKP